jgi:hypothetical protein
MISIFLQLHSPSWRRLAGLMTLGVSLGGATTAHAQVNPVERSNVHPRTIVQRSQAPQATGNKTQTASDEKMRIVDRRLNRTMRSVCVGC